MNKYSTFLQVFILFISFHSVATEKLEARKIQSNIIINGIADDESWQIAKWHSLDKLILGTLPTAQDFSGQFKIMWDEKQLYLLVEITDDVLFDQHADPLYFYWDDDCLEIFIDEDGSGGNHQFNFNAFAYHIALDNQVVDMGTPTASSKDNFILLNDHINSAWRRSTEHPHKIYWEVAVKVYNDSYQHNSNTAQNPVELSLGKRLGFMLAYCDNDGSENRESFIGSTFIKAVNGDKNLGFITADVFDSLILAK